MSATIIAVANQKGGTGKTTTCENLGVGLANKGKHVLLVDTDPQASLTIALGHPRPDDLLVTLTDLMTNVMQERPVNPEETILSHTEGVDLIPASIMLSGLEVSLVNAMSRETVLKQVLESVKSQYDFILLDCMPSIGMLTINALAAADQVLIPVQANYLSAKGLEQLLQTVSKVKRQINPRLKIEGILLTMVDSRTNCAKEISSLIRETYGGRLKVFSTDIPRSIRAAEISAEGVSIFKHDPGGKVADAQCGIQFMVAENGDDVQPLCHVLQDLNAIRTAVDHITEYIKRIRRFQVKRGQQRAPLVIATMNVGTNILHRVSLLRRFDRFLYFFSNHLTARENALSGVGEELLELVLSLRNPATIEMTFPKLVRWAIMSVHRFIDL